ncbi:MAG: glycosyltransferase family 4 protein [Chlamydiae bacterium]|nr:glycosyltransferase family 4 protein [Chlamydiota bacterium]
MKKILFFTQGPFENASSRVRVYQFLPGLESYGYQCQVLPALPEKEFHRYYLDSTFLGKCSFFGKMGLERIKHLFQLGGYDIIFLQREIFPCLPPFFEKIISLKAKKVVFDFDDAIFFSKRKPWLSGFQEFKIRRIMGWSDLVLAGNETLASFALDSHSNVHLLPSAVDTRRYVPLDKQVKSSELVIVWMGSPSTLHYLEEIRPVLEELSRETPFQLRVIGACPSSDWGMGAKFIPWDWKTEVQYLQTSDVGIMPLKDGLWERGKCGYKLLQYMACGLPVVASPVGVNQEIVEEGVNGFLAKDEKEWKKKLILLLKDASLRKKLGEAGRKTVEERYSLEQVFSCLLNLLNNLIES